jgi:branched-chain amino acid transport system permease protein
MSELLQFLFSGITVGAVYALVALGFTIIYNASDVVNFAQGEFVMLGGMITVFGHAMGAALPLAALIAIVATARSAWRSTSWPSNPHAALLWCR